MTKTSFKTAKGALIEIEVQGADLLITVNGNRVGGYVSDTGRDAMIILDDGRKAPVPAAAYRDVRAVTVELANNLEAERSPTQRLSERLTDAMGRRNSNH